jgi:hypothetical protein
LVDTHEEAVSPLCHLVVEILYDWPESTEG